MILLQIEKEFGGKNFEKRWTTFCMIPRLYNPANSAEKKTTDGNTWNARTNPIEGVPSSIACPGLRARGPNKNTAPLWEALSMEISKSLIHWMTDLEPANQKVKIPNTQAREKHPKIVFVFNFSASTGCPGDPGKNKKTTKRGQTISKIFHR